MASTKLKSILSFKEIDENPTVANFYRCSLLRRRQSADDRVVERIRYVKSTKVLTEFHYDGTQQESPHTGLDIYIDRSESIVQIEDV